MRMELDSLLEGLEAKLWLLIIAEMEVLLAEEVISALDELSALAESSRHAAGAAAEHRAKRLEATVARIDAELEAIERRLSVGAGKSLRPVKPASIVPGRGRAATTAARRGRGRPRKSETELAADNHVSEISAANNEEENVS